MSRLRHTLFLAVLLASPAAAQNLDSLLGRMTLAEKLGQLNLLSANGQASPQQLQLVRAGKLGRLFNVIGAENTTPVQRVAVTESRLKIPLLFGLDVIHGYRTIFPIPLGEASSFDPDAAEATARAAGQEAAAFGINWTYAPMVDIARDPRWGRIAEGSGEDPYLGSLLAAARVRGFQQTIFATAKHFAGYGAAEAGREYNETEISQRTMREIYLPPFKAAVDAGVASLMSAFNDIAGVPASGNAWLTDTVLRREWGFKGFVVSDWTSVTELINHGVAGSQAEAGRRGLTAGVDMDMQSSIYVDSLAALVRSNRIPLRVVDSAVMRILRAKQRLGLFRDPYRARTAPPNAELRALARRVAGESIVLLKNEKSLLPLDPNAGTIAVIGPLADNKEEPLGPWQRLRHRGQHDGGLRGGRRRRAAGQDRDSRARRTRRHERRSGQSLVAGVARCPATTLGGGRRDGNARRARAHERPPSDPRMGMGLRARDRRDVVPRRRSGERDGRRAVRRREPERPAAGHVPAGAGSDPAVLQPSQHGAAAGPEQQVHVEIHRRAGDAALPVRLRAVVHDVQLQQSQAQRGACPGGGHGDGDCDGGQHREPRRHGRRPALYP